MRIQIRKELREAQIIPKGYGIAWYEINRMVAVMYPIPLNIVIAHIRKLFLWLQQGDWYKTGYDKGYVKGIAEGRKYAFNQLKVQIIIQEADRLIRRGIDAVEELIKQKNEGKDVNGYYWKVIDEEVKNIDKHL